jgi:hypothetical protein
MARRYAAGIAAMVERGDPLMERLFVVEQRMEIPSTLDQVDDLDDAGLRALSARLRAEGRVDQHLGSDLREA